MTASAEGAALAEPAPGPSGPGAALLQRLDELAEEGGRGFDAPGCDLVARLVERAGALGGGAAGLLLARAERRLGALEARFERARARASEDFEQLEPERAAALAGSLEQGDFVRIRRARLRQGGLCGGSSASGRAAEAAAERYRDALADLATSLSRAARPAADPTPSGPLNGSRLATHILEAAEQLARGYRRSLVADLLDLAPLLHLPPLPAPRKRS